MSAEDSHFANRHTDNQIKIFSNVNVVSMESDAILWNQNVVVADDRILSVGGDCPIPSNATIIDGCGKFLMPGLADMHVHINSVNDLILYIANGITTVRNMREFKSYGLFPSVARMRDKINQGNLLGPTIHTAGMIYDGRPALPSPPLRKGTERVEVKEKVYKLLKRDQDMGYEFIKVYGHLSKEIYEEIIRVGMDLHMPVVGHVPDAVGIESALNLKQTSIEHLTGYDTFIGEGSIMDEDKLDQLVMKTKLNNIWNCPTTVVFTRYVPTEKLETFEHRPEMKYIAPIVKTFWRLERRKMNKLFEKNGWGYLADSVEVRKYMVKKLYDAGTGLLLGTDSMDPYVVPGFSIHEELKWMVEAGLTPFDAIKTGTVNAARFLDRADQFGTVSVGKRADLILVEGNPLEDIKCVKRISGVMVRGEWIEKKRLDELLKRIAKS